MAEKKLRILYAGSPLASSIVLKALLAESKNNNYEIIGVLTNPPSAQGRHKELIPTDVAKAASEWNDGISEGGLLKKLIIFTPAHLDSSAREQIEPLNADLLICFDYGRIFGPKFLAMFPLGGINLHPSALPKYRGCTPVPAAILAGDKMLGISVQKLALKTDEGDLLAQKEISLDGTETTESLMDGDGTHSAVTDAGIELLKNILKETACLSTTGTHVAPATHSVSAAASATSTSTATADATRCVFALPAAAPQSGESSYTPFIKKENGAIDWSRTAEEICRQIRAYTPWPGCYTKSNGVQLRILKAKPFESSSSESSASDSDSKEAGIVLSYDKSVGIKIMCGRGTILVVTELQWQGKKPMAYKDFMNGARDFIGTRFTN